MMQNLFTPNIPNGTSGQARYIDTVRTEITVYAPYDGFGPQPPPPVPDGFWEIGEGYLNPNYPDASSAAVIYGRGANTGSEAFFFVASAPFNGVPGTGDWGADGNYTVTVPLTPGSSFYGPASSPTVGQEGRFVLRFYHLVAFDLASGYWVYDVDIAVFKIFYPVSYGCTDPRALNYDPQADTEDGSCIYRYGCMDPEALNYDPLATRSNYSCIYPPPPVPGCRDPRALNYNPRATEDDGSCIYPVSSATPPTNGTVLSRDASRRTLALKPDASNPDKGLLLLSTMDAGHRFAGYGIPGVGGATWPCLAVGKSVGHIAVFFASKENTQVLNPANVQYVQRIYATGDGETGTDWKAPIPLWPGDYPALAAQGDRLAIAYQDQGVLLLRLSSDLGQNWDDPEQILAQFDGTIGGRVGIAWSGETLVVAVPGVLLLYSNATGSWKQGNIISDTQTDSLSFLPIAGVLLLAGRQGAGTTADPYRPVLFRSEDGGGHWSASAGPQADYAIGVVPETGRLLWDTTYHSDDDGRTWVEN